ncbi:hypothetical protein Micbo1qcDRAFT_172419 [Microdochium bolleyi]|uniref:Uncharacterized protein n=1 Tax=Microdochium bolleyi TaxID=196109 RepID=A0A136JG78_9PEZI|nr:hypothetical protein Micbo1qcDRAFT_172419 [Microdochium bolleyi]
METPSAAAATAAAAAARAARGRSTTKKRHALPLARASSQRPPDSSSNTDLPPTPTDQMAPSSFAYETPSPSSSRSVRGVRIRHGEAAVQSPEDPDSKGGRSLRRKPRIDYSFDQLVEDSEPAAARNTPTASRGIKKRKTDISFHDGDADEEHELRVKRRASEQPLSSAAGGSTRRRPAARKTTVEPQMWVPDQQADDAEVMDTIEVGGRHSMHSPDDFFRARTSSGGSSHHDLTPKAGPPLSAITQPPQPPSSPPPPIALASAITQPVVINGPVASADAAQDSAIEDPPVQSSQPPASPKPQVQDEPALPPAVVITSNSAPEAAPEINSVDVAQSASEEETRPESKPVSPEPRVQSVPHVESEAEPQAQSVAEPQVPVPVQHQVHEQAEEKVQTQVEDHVQEQAQPADPAPKPEPQSQDQTQPPLGQEQVPDHVQDQTEDQTQPEAQPDPQPQALPEVVKPQTPKKPTPVKEKISPAKDKTPSPVKTEAKPSLIITLRYPVAPKKSDSDPLAHLTPYVPGSTVLFPKIKTTAERDAEAEPEADAEQETAPEGEPDTVMDDAAQPGDDGGDEPAEAADEDTPIGTPLAMETAANSPAPEPEVTSGMPSKRQYAFRKTRDASEFTSLFDDIKGLPYTELYYRLEVANRALQAWQSEFNALRLITEDEDNSIRYHQEELAFQHREKMALSKDPTANPLRKDFVVKGTRAPKADPHLNYLRQQDKVMAQAYLFDYDDRESKIGQQDPVSQRSGTAGKARLRDRPKQTAKAAESDDPAVVSGKRARKAPTLFDGMEGASRSSTPVPSSQPKRRGRGARVDELGELLPPAVDANGDLVPVKKGKGGRPRKHPLPAPQTEPTSAPASQEDPPTLPTPNIVERPVRKRRRRDLDEEDEVLANGTVSEAGKKARRRNSRVSEIPTGSFYSQSSHYADEDNRPATASSTATNTTTASSPNNYSLREKRQKKFSLDDGEYDDIGGADDDDGTSRANARPSKRARRGPRKSYIEQVMPLQDDYGVGDLSQSEQPQSLAPKPTPKIKIKNYQPTSASPGMATVAATVAVPNNGPVSSPYSPAPSQTMDSPTTQTGSFYSNGHTPQTEPEAEKDYSTMTKSEKMSYSMKARWASGSMSAAVSKRRATLAAKKSARAATPPKTGPVTEVPTETPAAQ